MSRRHALIALAAAAAATGCGGRTGVLGLGTGAGAGGARPGEHSFEGASGLVGASGSGGLMGGAGSPAGGSAGSTGGTIGMGGTGGTIGAGGTGGTIGTGGIIDPCAGVRCKAPSCPPGSEQVTPPDQCCPVCTPPTCSSCGPPFVCPPGSSVVTLPGACCPSCSAVTMMPWTPANLGPVLVFWFDPTSLVRVAASVARWSDLSGNGNDATQTMANYQPVYNPSGINGLPSATFYGPVTFLDIPDKVSLQWGGSDFAVFAVVRATAETGSDAMIYQKTGAYPFDAVALYLNADKPAPTTLAAAQVSGDIYVVSSSPPATFVDGTTHVLGARRARGTLEVRVDGRVSQSITTTAVASVDVSAPGSDAIIGQNGYGTPSPEFQQFHGDIAEIVGARGEIADADVAALEQYFMTRYGP